jgi:quinoprotein relay system zinc metallohydrolase 2
VLVHIGTVALTTPQNRGDIANITFLLGRDGVAVIDTGGSVAVGRRALAALRRITDKPVRYVINTHEHPDHIFGNAAFLGAGPGGADPRFVGHRNLARQIAERGPFYLRSFREALGEAAIAEVRLLPPTLEVADTATLDLGDRLLRLTAWPPAHTDCDLTVTDEATGTLIAGDLLFVQHVPVLDGSLRSWLSLLPRLEAAGAKRVIPGHGPIPAVPGPAFADEARYLEALARDARAAIARGASLAAAVPQIAIAERDRWALFDDYNPRNATTAFSELEWE